MRSEQDNVHTVHILQCRTSCPKSLSHHPLLSAIALFTLSDSHTYQCLAMRLTTSVLSLVACSTLLAACLKDKSLRSHPAYDALAPSSVYLYVM